VSDGSQTQALDAVGWLRLASMDAVTRVGPHVGLLEESAPILARCVPPRLSRRRGALGGEMGADGERATTCWRRQPPSAGLTTPKVSWVARIEPEWMTEGLR
jgi:hypothetical protein